MVDFDDLESRLPLHIVRAAGLSVVTDERGIQHVGCEVFASVDTAWLQLRFTAQTGLVFPIARVTTGDTCRTNLKVHREDFMIAGYAIFGSYDDVVFDASAGTVSFRNLEQLPTLPAPTRSIRPLPMYSWLIARTSKGGDEVRLTRETDLAGPRYLMPVSSSLIPKRLVLVRHPGSLSEADSKWQSSPDRGDRVELVFLRRSTAISVVSSVEEKGTHAMLVEVDRGSMTVEMVATLCT